ncbi:Putative Anucleate primary sterigmata protein A [Rhizopus microsporus]|nr:Putative Anucleate primary sterigmata protein A [Rhizopus microsporus]
MKNRHEQDMSAIRRHAAALQREKSDQTKQIETLASELAIAKAQSRIAKHVISEAEPSTRSEQSDDQNLSTPTVKNDTSPASSPPPSPKQLPTSRSQAMEVETLKTSLAHAHRMVSNLRSNLHKEKTEKFELKKLLAESQETIEQLQNDPRLWVDARPVRSSSSHLGSKDDGRRPHKASTPSTKRRGRKTGDSASRRGKFKNASSRHADNDSVYSYSSMSDNSGDDSASESDAPVSPFDNAPSVGFTTLSSELSQSQMTQKPVAVDAEVNTDPVHIESVHPSLGDKLDKLSSETSPIKQLAGGLVAGAAVAVGSLLPTKSGVEISIQTEPKPEGIDCLVQTHAVPTASLSTQTDDSSSLDEPKVAVDASIQTEIEPKAVGVEMSIQTDDVSTSKSAVEISSKPSSRNTLSSLAALNEPGSRHNLKMTEDPIHKKPLTPHMSRADSMFGSKPTSIHALMEAKPTENETRFYDKDGAENKLFTKEEADAMIAAAVAVALSKANDDKNASRRDSALVSSAEKPDDIEEQEEDDNGFGNVAIQVPREVIATSIQTVEKERARPDLADGPSIVFDQEPEEQVWSENNIPQRPSNPPPAALLNRAVSPNRLSKGKMPETEGEPQQSLHRGTASMSSLSTANTNEQLHSIASSHFDNRSTNATDPLMISLITKTMIGDWLWKYTRNAMGGGISEKRHQRYFWIHPYTRTLYWSNKAPGVDGTETKAKSALIENITVVPDYSTTPSGLPNVSLLIQTSHRQLKLTAPTLEKHDTWFESISHLLVRNNELSSGSVGDNRPNNTNNVKSVSSGASGSLLERPSFRRLHDMFYQPSTSTATATYGTENTANGDYEDEPLEDVRMCCNGKHHVSKLEREHNHRQYRKRTSRIPNQQH